jgi:ParB-like chromosome segregation protein Spo0J
MSGVRMPEGVTLWPIAKLSPYFRNPRTHTQDQVVTMARLMRRFGWTDPIVVDEQNGILAGHLRYAAALHMGLKQVPVIEVTHLTEEEKRAFVVGHNAIALKSGWDPRLLAGHMEGIQDEELTVLAGISDAELERLEQQASAGIQELERAGTDPGQDQDGGGGTEAAAGQGPARDQLTQVKCPHCQLEFYLAPPAQEG